MAHAGPFFLHDLWENHQMILSESHGKSQKHIRHINLGKFHHDLTATEPWNIWNNGQ